MLIYRLDTQMQFYQKDRLMDRSVGEHLLHKVQDL